MGKRQVKEAEAAERKWRMRDIIESERERERDEGREREAEKENLNAPH